jgi:arylformamidase
MNPTPLYQLNRNDFPEVLISGEIWVFDGSKTIFHTSEVNSRYPARSLLKPFQFLAMGHLELKTVQEWHVAALGSISAHADQVDQLKRWTSQSPVAELVSRLHLPVAHACFPKHLAIAQTCQNRGWPIEGYLTQSHPFHQSVLKTLSRMLGEPEESFEFVVDGCKLPSPVLRLDQMARLFQVLAQGAIDPQLQTIRDLMISHPDWIGGPERIDSRLMKKNQKCLIAKEGADGLLGIGLLPNSTYPQGLGVVVKIASGYQPAAAALAVKPVLEKLGLQCDVPVPEGQSIQYRYEPFKPSKKKWIDISPSLNSKIAVWPGDEAFSRKVVLNIEEGKHMTLSSINTTLHVGAHADSPNHFGKGKNGIDQVELWKYEGACQIIAVIKTPHTEITIEDIRGLKIVAPRVLFKTNSFPDPNQFNTDFCAFSASLIEYLAGEGVVLMGIDTPSIDLFESKELASHKATLKTGMAILEGLILDRVEPGIYELVAFPLKIEGGDASPVRALLLNSKRPSAF